jgi:hypothetical protein
MTNAITTTMKIEIQTIWSPDLNPPSEGLPDDVKNFYLIHFLAKIGMRLSISFLVF